MSGLTTHVLDTMHGRPAAGMSLRLLRGAETLVATVTNLDGRLDRPLLAGSALRAGGYRLEFDVGEYFRDMGVPLSQPSFLETVVVDFSVDEPESHYHVPLLVSPFAYSTYRGS
ncbi:MAG: hydroxyisourate hydrolase [Phenylobacterium sp.]|uniref:hydroxyisourate hydrolase n=1 Tax=Phenylobacterium sp. TaxID=1871053 RepID=UPI001A525084|nr:hydroxyisourate hydrolase [Phenylobacterium sp.]MBL8556795.1 hydroxyisourate hydrolase [Phenylobacterium sp.]